MSVIVKGPITSPFIASKLAPCEGLSDCGAHSIFLGRVRADQHGEQVVTGIEYSAYRGMAEKVARRIAAQACSQFGVKEVRIFHSVGWVKCGEVSLLVVVDSAHRKASFQALEWVVDTLKTDFPAWKKEIFADNRHRWI